MTFTSPFRAHICGLFNKQTLAKGHPSIIRYDGPV